jgi:hypothetical protein
MIKATKRVTFILDGLDEIPVENIPPSGIIGSNLLLTWPNARVVITSRIDCLQSLETKYSGTSYRTHLTQGQSDLEEVFLMPFNDEQVSGYVHSYVKTEDAEWTDPIKCLQTIKDTSGVAELTRTPIVLTFILSVLAKLVPKPGRHTMSDVYGAFVEQFFERETWKELSQAELSLSENRPLQFARLAETLGQRLFAQGTTTMMPQGVDPKLIRGIPRHQFADGSFSFIHKSIQEYFTALEWLRVLEAGNNERSQAVLGARLASSETGLLRFVVELFRTSSHFEPTLQQVLSARTNHLASPHHSHIECIASANSMTILAATRSNLSNIDLSNICARGACLDGMIADGTNLSRADLIGASLRRAWLNNADLRDADLSTVQFGQFPNIRPSSAIEFVTVFKEKLLVVDRTIAGLWDIETGRLAEVLCKNPKLILQQPGDWRETWFVDGGILMCACYYKKAVYVWNSVTLKTVELNYCQEHTEYICVSTGRIITAQHFNGSGAFVWDLATGNCIRTIQYPYDILKIIASQDILAICGASEILIWDLLTGKQLAALASPAEELAIYGTKLLAPNRDHVVLWDFVTNKQTKLPINSRKVFIIDGMGFLLGDFVTIVDLKTFQVVGCFDIEEGITFIGCLQQKICCVSMYEISVREFPTPGSTQKSPFQYKCVAANTGLIFVGCSDGTVLLWESKVLCSLHSLALSHFLRPR